MLSCLLRACLGCSLGSDPKLARGSGFLGFLGRGLISMACEVECRLRRYVHFKFRMRPRPPAQGMLFCFESMRVFSDQSIFLQWWSLVLTTDGLGSVYLQILIKRVQAMDSHAVLVSTFSFNLALCHCVTRTFAFFYLALSTVVQAPKNAMIWQAKSEKKFTAKATERHSSGNHGHEV